MLALLRRLPGFVARLLMAPVVAWQAGALWFDGPASRPLAAVLAALCALVSVTFLFIVRPARRGWLLFALLFAVVLVWWLSIQPRNDRTWLPDVAELARAEIDGDRVTIHNVRNFTWRSDTDFDVRWETRTYDLAQLTGLDLFLSYWGSRAIAHTIMSWEFADGQHLAISIETRKEEGEEYSAVRGFFRQYELVYTVADERDVIGVRAGPRGEDLYLYRLRTPPERARKLLLQYLERVNSLATYPAWYNAADKNCTTTIFDNVQPVVGKVPLDWRIFVNGYIDEMLFDEGVISRTLPFEELRARSAVSWAARDAGSREDFGGHIRQGLPARPPPP